MRRPNGAGAVIKMSGKRRRPYAVRVFDGVKVDESGNGKLKYKYLGYFEKQSEALQFLEKYNSTPVTLAKPVANIGKHRFSDIYNLYIEELTLRSKKLSKQSFDSRNAAYKNLKPLHPMIFEALTLDDLENTVKMCSHMSLSTITNIMIVLKGMYKTAMRHKYVSEDLSALMIVDHLDENKRPHTPFTDQEIETLWQNTDNVYVRLYLILIYSGMRINELLSMKSKDVHLEERYMIGGLKTEAGKNRIIPISEKIVSFLDTSDEYLIIHKKGKRMSYSHALVESRKVLDDLGMNHTFHDAKHTCASLLERANVDMLHRKLILGHRISDITDRYTHVKKEDLIADINKI